MPDIDHGKTVFFSQFSVMIFHIAGDKNVRAGGKHFSDQASPTSGTNGNAAELVMPGSPATLTVRVPKAVT